MLSQVPYTAILLSCFDFFDNNLLVGFKDHEFNKFDDVYFLQKYFIRFGAATLSLLIAQAACYPLDTAKRCLQMNGALAHKKLYSGSLINCLMELRTNQGIVGGWYAGFSLNLVRCAPLTLI